MDSDDDVDTVNKVQLIRLVRERPVLWNKTAEDYKSRSMTVIAWRQVCGELHQDFAALTDRQKTEYSEWPHGGLTSAGQPHFHVSLLLAVIGTPFENQMIFLSFSIKMLDTSTREINFFLTCVCVCHSPRPGHAMHSGWSGVLSPLVSTFGSFQSFWKKAGR